MIPDDMLMTLMITGIILIGSVLFTMTFFAFFFVVWPKYEDTLLKEPEQSDKSYKQRSHKNIFFTIAGIILAAIIILAICLSSGSAKNNIDDNYDNLGMNDLYNIEREVDDV